MKELRNNVINFFFYIWNKSLKDLNSRVYGYTLVESLVDFIYIFLLFLFAIFSVKWSIGEPMDFLGMISPANEKQFLINNILMEIYGIALVILFSVFFFLLFCLEVHEPINYHMSNINFSEEEENLLDALFILIPTFLIFCMLIPTLGFLYKYDFIDSTNSNSILFEVHVVGRQWYWEYTYHLESFIPIIAPYIGEKDLNSWNFTFESRLVKHNLLSNLYALGVDKPLVLPIGYPILLSVTGGDVIHSFFVPALGIKLDAIPGKQAYEIIQNNHEITLFGQCAELCGVEHGYMPIQIEWINLEQWFCWVSLQTDLVYKK